VPITEAEESKAETVRELEEVMLCIADVQVCTEEYKKKYEPNQDQECFL
jgi:hypothetical protein